MTRRLGRLAILAVILLLLAGCAAQKVFRQAEHHAQRERWDQAVLGYAKALALDPGNTRYSVALTRAKIRASNAHFERGKRYLEAGQLDLGIQELQQTVVLDSANQYAMNELGKALELQRIKAGAMSEIERMKRMAAERAAAMGPPKLDPTSNIPIVLQFPDSTVSKVYDAVSKASGINFLFDERINLDDELSIDVANVSFSKAMDILMLQNKHFYKVIDAHTILIAEDNRQSRQEYEDLVIRTFYLSNAETKQIQTLLRTLLDTRKVTENPTLNSITIKDTPEKIAIADLIIGANDKSKAELILDVELLEVNRTTAQDLGLDLSSKSLTLSFRGGNVSVPLNNLGVVNDQADWLLGPVPSIILSFLKSDSDTKTIAKPQLRVSEGEKAEFVIGDRVPIPATTFNTSQTIGGNIVPVTSFTYQNVGITVEIEPRVHHNKEITLQVKVEVSALSGEVEGTGGVSQPIIGTRNISTTIRLKDGETNMLAGLIKEEDRQSMSGVPGLSDIPGLNRIFGSTSDSIQKTDIVLTLTPHIIRIPDITPTDLLPLWVGTEEKVQLRGPVYNAWGESPFESPEGPDGLPADGEALPRPDEGTRLEGGTDDASARAARRSRRDAEMEESEAQRWEGRRRPRAGAEDEEAGGPPPAEGETEGETEGGEAEEPRTPRTVARIQLVPSATTLEVGDSLNLSVQVSGAQDVGSVSFRLRYDPSVLEFVPPALPGDFLEQEGGSSNVSAVEAASGGEMVVTANRFGSGAGGTGTLATFQFVALQPGPAGLGFTAATVKDPDDANLPSSFRTAQVTVTE